MNTTKKRIGKKTGISLFTVAMLIMFIQPGLNIFTRVIGIVIMGFGIFVMMTSDVRETR